MILHGDAKVMAAFVKARGEIGATVAKDGTGNYGKYATLAALTEATTEHLAKHGCAIVQEASTDEAGVLVKTWLLHESGGYIEFEPLPLPVANRTAQAVGSAITYARRYALAAVCGIAPDDDDGEAATHAQTQRKPQPAQQQTPQAQKTPQQASTPATRQTASEAQLKRLHAVGSQAYGDAWDAQRHKLVQAVSKGAIESSNDLTPKECADLIAGIEAKLAAQTEEKFDAAPTASATMRQRVAEQAH